MGNRSADEDLLAGLLAWRHHAVTHHDLLEALREWSPDGPRSLARILAERGAVSSENEARFEALAREGEPVGESATRELPDARYQIIRPHAHGGLGEVYVAFDRELSRQVALKQLRDRFADDPSSRARFLQEAEITGGLEHPGIVPVYSLGEHVDGRPYYAMRLIRGHSLRDAIERFHQAEREGREPSDHALELRSLLGQFVDVCNALAYAHSRGVLHRDVKPANILLGRFGETLLVDWGLAKSVDRPDLPPPQGGESPPIALNLKPGGSSTLLGTALGTPGFMSPEQAEGRLDLLSPASDVYSLGASLFHLLTGKLAFDDPDAALVLEMCRAGKFPRPRAVNRSVAPALEAICLKAMALRPIDRYPTALAMATEIEHWLADEPVAAYRESWSHRLARWARRRRGR